MAPKDPKTEVMQGEAFPPYLEVGHKLHDKLEEKQPCIVPEKRHGNDPFKLLFYIGLQLRESVEGLTYSREDHRALGFTDEDVAIIDAAHEKGAPIVMYGLSGLDLPFHLIPILMKDLFEESGLPEEALRNLTVKDFADIMREGWFQDMLTAMAKTRNGVWRSVGSYIGDYDEPEKIKRQSEFPEPDENIFDIELDSRTDTPAHIARAALSPNFGHHLSHMLHGTDSVGCPVAASQRAIDPSNPHMDYLVTNGHLKIEERKNGKKVGRQTVSPIERSAVVFADFIDKYIEEQARQETAHTADEYSPLR